MFGRSFGGPPAAATEARPELVPRSPKKTSRRESLDQYASSAFRETSQGLLPSARISHSSGRGRGTRSLYGGQSGPRNAATKRPSGEGMGSSQLPAPKVSCASPAPEGSIE